MSIPVILLILSALLILPILIRGAQEDLKSRTFPKELWDSMLVNVAGFCTILMYLMLLSSGQFYAVALQVGVSIFGFLFCMFMGYRFGSGGDWRAFAYISLITPALVIQTAVVSLVVGLCQSIFEANRTKDFAHVTIPFAVSIAVGYILVIPMVIWINLP